MTTFNELGLSPLIVQAVADTGYTTPTPIQEQAIPVALAGRDVLGIAQTGTGKTAAFTLPLIDRLASGRARANMPRALVLAPTRELADQVAESFRKYAKGTKLSWALLIGGVSMGDQLSALNKGVDVLIATPGRLLDLFDRGKLMLIGVQTMVVDEADRMLDMGFIPDLERIFKLTPPKRQTLFFSATMPPEITRLTNQFLKDPTRIEVARPATTADTIAQHLVRIPSTDPKAKRLALRALIERSGEALNNGIVFCNRKSEVDIVAKSLKVHGYDAAPIHGDLDQSLRMKTLADFRSGALKLLVASDVAARGLDIPEVSHVFNYDVPHHADDYVHRIGRTGRAGRTGDTFMIVTPADDRNLDKVLKLIGKTPDEVTLDLDWASAKSEPRRDSGRGGRGGGERGGSRGRRSERSYAPPPSADPADHAPTTPLVPTERTEATEGPADVAAARPARERRPRRGEARGDEGREPRAPREDRPAREERAPREERPRRTRERSEATESAPPARERPAERSRGVQAPADADDRGVRGFGADTPAFLMRAPPKTKD